MDLKSAYGLNGSGAGLIVYTPSLRMDTNYATHEFDNRALAQDLVVGKHYKVTIDNFQYITGDQKGFTIREYNYDTDNTGAVWNITSDPGPVTLDIPSLSYPDLLIYNGIVGDTKGNAMSFTNIRVFVVEDIGGNLLPNSGGVSYSNYLLSNSNVAIKYQLSGNTFYPELKVTHPNSGVWGIYYNVSNSIGYYDNRLVKVGSIYNVSFQIWTDSTITEIRSPFSELSPTDYGSDLTVTPQVWKNCWYVAKPSTSGNMTLYVNSNTHSTFYIRNIRVTECTEDDTYYMAWIPSYDSHEQNTKLPDIYETSSLLDNHNRPRDTYHFQPNCRLPSTLTKIGWPLGGDMKSGIQVLENSASTENYRYSSYFNMPAGTNYQVSFWAKCSSNLKNADVFVLPDNYQGEGLNTVTFPVNARWQFFRYIFTSPGTWVSSVRIRFDNNGSTNGSKAYLWFKGVNITTDSDTSNSLKDWEGYKYQVATYIDTSTGEWVYDGTTRTREVYDRANILWSDSSSSGWIDFGTTTETETAVLSSLSLISNSSNMPTSGTGANSGVWVKANGGVCTVKVRANYKFNDGKTVAVDVTDDCTYSYTSNGTGTWDSTNHTMTIPSAGTTITDNTYTNIVYVTYNGITRDDLNFGRQANAVTSVSTPTGGTLTVDDIPAKGGTINSGTVGGTVSQTRTFTSGATDVYTVSTPTGGTFNSVTAPSLDTTIKKSTVVGTLTYTYTLNGKTGTIGTTIAQQGNFVTSITLSAGTFSYTNISAGATSATPVSNAATKTYMFTSGATSTTVPSSVYGTQSVSDTYSLATVQNGFSAINSSNGVLTATSRGSTVGPAWTSGTVTRTITVTWTPTTEYNDQGAKTATIKPTATCTQNENKVTKLEAGVNDTSISTVHFYYPNQPIPASGGTLNISGNGKGILTFSSGSVVTESSFAGNKYGGTLTYSRSFSMPATTGFTLNTSTGAVTGANRTTTTGDARTSSVITSTLTLTFTHPASMGSTEVNGSISGTQTVSQQANQIIAYGNPTGGTLTVDDIPAKGGTISSGTIGGTVSQTRTYTSGDTDTYSQATPTDGSYSKAITGYNLGIIVTSRTSKGTLTYTYTLNGKSGSISATVYQQANTWEYHRMTLSASSTSIDANGGTVTLHTGIYTMYASGTEDLAGSDFVSSWSGSADGFTLEDFKLTAANRDTTVGAARSITITASYKVLTSNSVTVTQAANAATSITYGTPSITLSYGTIGAGGGTVSPSLSYSQPRTQNYTSGGTSALSAVTSGATISYAKVPESGSGTVDTKTGAVTAASRGTTVDTANTTAATVRVTVTLNSKSATKDANVSQTRNQATTITYGTPSVTVTCSDVPASGGSVTSGTASYSQSRTQNYTSGATSALSALTTGGTVSWSGGASNIASLGTIKKARTAVGSALKATVTLNGKSGTGQTTVYQQANEFSDDSMKLHFSSWTGANTISVGAGSTTIAVYLEVTRLYTSGTYQPGHNVTTRGTFTVSGTLFEASVSGTNIIVASRGINTGPALTGTVTGKYNHLTATGTITQAENKETISDSGGVTTYGDVTAGAIFNKTIPASGGSATATAGNGSQTWSKTAVIRTFKYTSGSTSQITVTDATSGTNAVAPNVSSKTGTASSKGTVVSNQTTVASQQVTWSANGKSASAWMYVYQEANAITSTSGSVSLSYTPSRINYTGGSAYPNLRVTAISKFTSGSSKSRTLSSSEYSATYGGAATSYGTITASRNSGPERSFTATVTVTSTATA